MVSKQKGAFLVAGSLIYYIHYMNDVPAVQTSIICAFNCLSQRNITIVPGHHFGAFHRAVDPPCHEAR
jgi:hypothetical protein